VKKIIILTGCSLISVVFFIIPLSCYAQPYGKGIYNANVPYGDETSLSISTNASLDIPITPTSAGTLATGLNAITVTSTDVIGYQLYIRSLDNNTYMDNLGSQIPASNNVSPGAALATNTWGYKTPELTNYVGIKTTDTLIHSATAPFSSGEITNVTFGVYVNMEKPAGNYVAKVVYTAVPQTN